jgi:hypothetical protein
MKLLSFLRWKIKQTSFEDICWYIGVILVSIGVGSDFNKTYIIAGTLFWMIIFVKLLINSYKQQYQEFKEEQNKLFETIKHSDQK